MISFILLAQLAQPLPRIGTCPIGYYGANDYCIPLRQTTPAIIKEGTSCPLGYYNAGSYCKQTR
jgi:hypothetical protein